MKKVVSSIVALLGVFVAMPIWLFLLYSILVAIQPDRLVWFLYIAYIPVEICIALFIAIVRILENQE